MVKGCKLISLEVVVSADVENVQDAEDLAARAIVTHLFSIGCMDLGGIGKSAGAVPIGQCLFRAHRAAQCACSTQRFALLAFLTVNFAKRYPAKCASFSIVTGQPSPPRSKLAIRLLAGIARSCSRRQRSLRGLARRLVCETLRTCARARRADMRAGTLLAAAIDWNRLQVMQRNSEQGAQTFSYQSLLCIVF